jgi:hypothetical protein
MREASSLSLSRVLDFNVVQPPFYMREESVGTSRMTMQEQMSEWDARFGFELSNASESELNNHGQTSSSNNQNGETEDPKSSEIHAISTTFEDPSVDQQDSLENKSISGITEVATNIALSPTFMPSMSRSRDSSRSNNIFTDRDESTDSKTDANYDQDDSGDESTVLGTEDGVEVKSMIMQTLVSCVLAACSHDLAFTARLIPQIHSLVHNWTYNYDRTYTVAAGGNSGAGSANTYEAENSFTAALPGNRGAGTSQKRVRDSDSGEALSRSERRQRISVSTDPRQNSPSPTLPPFACHFHKKDPRKYNFRDNRKYKSCPHPSIPHNDLRRIK